MPINKTSIEWVKNPDGSQGYTWNPITGCLNGCPYCYARKLANGRLRQRYLANMNCPTSVDFRNGQYRPDANAYLDPFYPRFWPERLEEFSELAYKPRGIFTCDMSDLFGIGVPEEWTRKVLSTIKYQFFHRFYLLTNQPQNLPQWSPFPDNCCVGVTTTNQKALYDAVKYLSQIEASIKFLSLEPYLERMFIPVWALSFIDWVIIGACTGTKKDLIELNKKYPELTLMPYGRKWSLQPPVEWVEEIVRVAGQAGTPVFLKDNLMPLIIDQPRVPSWSSDNKGLRQEMPE